MCCQVNGGSPRTSLGEDQRADGHCGASAAEEHLRQALRLRDEELSLLRSANDGLQREKSECERLLREVNRAADGVMHDAPGLLSSSSALSTPASASTGETSDAVRALSAKLNNLRAIIQRSKGEGGGGGSSGRASLPSDEDGAQRSSTPARGGRGRTSSCSTDSDRGWGGEEAPLAPGSGVAERDPAGLGVPETPAHLRAFKKNVFDRLTAERNKV